MDKSTPREAVCKVFENVNTGGVSLTVFELVTATFATYEFDLRGDWEANKRRIHALDKDIRTDVTESVDETAFLTTVTLFTNYKRKRDGLSGAVSCKRKTCWTCDSRIIRQTRKSSSRAMSLLANFAIAVRI